MPRDSSGTYTLPTADEQPGLTISSNNENARNNDYATEFTDSLSRTGKGTMAVPFQALDGTRGAPSYAFASEQDSGLYRVTAGDIRLSVTDGDSVLFAKTGILTNTIRVINAKHRGAVANGVADDGPLLQSLIDELGNAGGGILDLDVGVYGVGATLFVDYDDVMIVGRGRGRYNNRADSIREAATALKWIGAAGGPLLMFASDRALAGGQTTKAGGGIMDVLLDGNSVCTIGLEVRTWINLRTYIMTLQFTSIHFYIHVQSSAPASNNPKSTRHCIFDIMTAETDSTDEADVLGVITGTPGSSENVHHCIFKLVLRSKTSARALDIENSDNCLFTMIDAGVQETPVGDAGLITLHASDTLTIFPPSGNARFHTFNHFESQEGLLVKTIASTGFSSGGHIINHLLKSNGSKDPVVENGAFLRWTRSSDLNTYTKPPSLIGTQFRGVVLRTLTTGMLTGATTAIIWDSSEIDTDSAWSSGTDVVVPQGVYTCYADFTVAWAANATGARVARLRKNGSNVTNGSARVPGSATALWQPGGTVLEVAPGDVLTLVVTQDSGATVNVTQDETALTLYWL